MVYLYTFLVKYDKITMFWILIDKYIMSKVKNTMKELPCSEMPYEKCLEHGAPYLSDAELLAIIKKTGSRDKTSYELANEILKLHPVHKGIAGLFYLTRQDYCSLQGIGPVKAIQLLSVVELAKRLSRTTKAKKVCFRKPSEIADYFMAEMRCLETEHVYAAYLDSAGGLLSYKTVFAGTINSSFANPREILRQALQHDAAHFVVLHNHPSGDPSPSREDFAMTQKLKKAADMIGIPLIDHIIVGDNQYYSLKEQGYI